MNEVNSIVRGGWSNNQNGKEEEKRVREGEHRIGQHRIE